MDSSRFSLLSSLRGEFKAEDYIQPHYKEAYRLAIDRLLSGGRDSYQEFLKGERVGTFLSEDELTFITTNAEQPPTQNQTEEINIQNQMDTQSSSGTYWPMHSDVDTPDLDLGWPEVRHDKLQTNIDLLFHPPRQNNRTIKEVIRKHIQDARQVIAIVMDRFTDVDIFRETVEASLRGVAVYVLLDHIHLKSFLTMAENQDVKIQQLRNMRVRTVKGQDYLCQSGAKFHGAMEQKFLLVDCCTAFYGSYSFTWSFEKINLSMVQVITGHLVKSYDEEFRTLYARSTVPAELSAPLGLPQHNGLHAQHILPKCMPNPGPKLDRGNHLRHTTDPVYRKTCEKSHGLTNLEERLLQEEPLRPLFDSGIGAQMSAEVNYNKRHSYAGERQDGYIPQNMRNRGSNWNVSGDTGQNNFTMDNYLPAAQLHRGQLKRQTFNCKDVQLSMQQNIPNHENTSKGYMRTWRIESYLKNSDTPLKESCDYLDQLDPLDKANSFMQGRIRTSLVFRSTIPEQAEVDMLVNNSSVGRSHLAPNTPLHYSSMQWNPCLEENRMSNKESAFQRQSLQILDDNKNYSSGGNSYYSSYASLGRPKGGHILTNPDMFNDNWHKRHSVADPRSNSNYIHEEQLHVPLARMQINRSSMGINAPNGGYLSALNEDQRSVSHYDVKSIKGPKCPNIPTWQEPPFRAVSAAALDVNTENINGPSNMNKSSQKMKSLLYIQDKKDDVSMDGASITSGESTVTLTTEDEIKSQDRGKHRQSPKSSGRTTSQKHRNQEADDPLATSKPRFTTEEHRYHPHISDIKNDTPKKNMFADKSSKPSYETRSLKKDYSAEHHKFSKCEPSPEKKHHVRSASYVSTQAQKKTRSLTKGEASIEHHHSQVARGNHENKFEKFFQRMGNFINKHK